jgi:Zn-dependent protease/predicted transcriptional regulator
VAVWWRIESWGVTVAALRRTHDASTRKGANLEALTLGRIAGIEIRVHYSWFLIFFLLIWWLGDGFFSEVYDTWSTTEAWAAAVAASILFFASVLLHELAHSLTAKRLGLPVSSITLFIFGGISSLTSEPATAKQEFQVAIVGPGTSFVLAAICGLAAGVALVGDVENSPPAAVAEYLAIINLSLGVFNLLPGFPLDGGRVLRAAVWSRSGDVLKATRWASRAGLIISFGLIAIGVVSILGGNFVGGAWMIVIGWFLRGAAQSSYEQLVVRRILGDVRVRDVLDRGFVAVAPDDNLEEVVRRMLQNSRRCVPVLAADDLLGLISIRDLQRVPQEEWPQTSAFRAMTPREKLHVTSSDADLAGVMETMAANDVHQLPVVDGGLFVGFVTRADVLRLLQVRSELREPRTA